MKAVIRACALALVLALPAGAEVLTPQALRDFGAKALREGYADQALGLAEALLSRDPHDVQALILKSQALRVLGRLPEAQAAARQAWDLAGTQGQRYVAATSLAQALSLNGQRIAAQYWLRQAVTVAPSPGAARQAAEDLRYVRGESALALRFDLKTQPSDNVNGGTRATSVEIYGLSLPLPEKLTALPGTAWSLGLGADWRVAAGPRSETVLSFDLQRSGAKLDEAVSGLSSSDFDFTHLGVALARKGRQGGKLAVEIGRNWYGGEDLSATFGLEAQTLRPLGSGRADLSFGLTREARLDDAKASSTQAQIEAGWQVAGPHGDTWRFSASLARALSDSASVDRREAGVALDWQAGHDLAGLGLSAHLGLTGADYASGRNEGRLRASLEAELPQLGWMGFAPVVSLAYARSNSNALLYDIDSLGLGVSLRSRF